MFNPIKSIKNTVNRYTDKDFIEYAKKDFTLPLMVANNVFGAVIGVAAGVLYANDLMDKKDFAGVMLCDAGIVGCDALWLVNERMEYDKKIQRERMMESFNEGMERVHNRFRYNWEYKDVVDVDYTVEE